MERDGEAQSALRDRLHCAQFERVPERISADQEWPGGPLSVVVLSGRTPAALMESHSAERLGVVRQRDQRAALSSDPVRGAQRLWHPRVWGTVVGAAGATVFVMSNRNGLPGPWPTVALVAWAIALLAYLFFVFGWPRVLTEMDEVGPLSGLVYLGSVVGMLILIRLGNVFLPGSRVDDLQPVVVVIAVGLHFLPFAKAFHTPMFTVLGTLMAVIGAAGFGLAWFWDERAAAGSAVLAGLVMLTVIAGDATYQPPASTKSGSLTKRESPR